jgi:alkyl hydroperoxide reductase subunit AhpC
MSTLVTQAAPDFTADAIVDGDFGSVTLSSYRGKWVVLFFYPLDFTFVCPTEINAFSDRAEEFRAIGADIIGASVDSKFSHFAWINTPRGEGGLGGCNYPLVADLTKNIARSYGVLKEEAGVALRGLFIINPEGQVAYEVVHDLAVGRSVDETLRVLKAFQKTAETGEVCPAGWDDGADTMKGDTHGSREYFNKLG